MTALRLAKVCALFGSPYEGERSAAAAIADKLVQGLSVEELIAYALHSGVLNDWEVGFLRSIKQREFLSRKQRAKLDALVRKAQRGG